MRTKFVVSLLAVVCFFASHTMASWNSASDYSTVGQPSNDWYYGHTTGAVDSGVFTQLPESASYFYMGISGWFDSSNWATQCQANEGDSAIEVDFWGDMFVADPLTTDMAQKNYDGQMATFRWIAPAAGQYTIDADFWGAQYTNGGTTSEVYIVAAGTIIFQDSIDGFAGGNGREAFGTDQTASYTGVVTLQAGDYIDIIQGIGSGNDITGLNVTIIPEPATISLLGIGLLAVIRKSRS